jgi:Na+-transporting methylmalonyl-CoA/oxaloacetate decarboxylase gamma subunit
MEMADIYYGIFGFLFLFLIFLVIRGIYHLIVRAFKKYTQYKGRH